MTSSDGQINENYNFRNEVVLEEYVYVMFVLCVRLFSFPDRIELNKLQQFKPLCVIRYLYQ